MVNSWLCRIALATLLGSFVSGPSIINVGPVDINVFDTLFSVSCVLFLVSTTLQRRLYVRLNGISALGLMYPSVVVVASLLGAISYGYPSGYIVGDMRWVQAIFLEIILFHAYRYSDSIVEGFRYVIYCGIIVNIFFVILQMLAATSGEPAQLLEWWYKDVPNTSQRPLGFYLNRFSGAVGQPSSLGFFAAMSIGYALVVMKDSTMQLSVLVGAILLLISSGSRTALAATFAVVTGYLIFLAENNRLRYTIYFCLVASIALPLAISLDLGRVGSGRYKALLDIATGDMAYHEAAGREGRWEEAISRRNEEYLFLGTLSNPSHVYSDLIIDSGYFHVFTRLGPLGLPFLGITLLTPLFLLTIKKRGHHILAAGVILGIVGIMAINQNSFSGIQVKNMVLFSTFLISSRPM